MRRTLEKQELYLYSQSTKYFPKSTLAGELPLETQAALAHINSRGEGTARGELGGLLEVNGANVRRRLARPGPVKVKQAWDL